ncbi:PhzF family phenazine biosynthesis protein [Spirosoma jeollabukense]
MEGIRFYIVDVFAINKYEGNQLAVFLDLDDQLPEQQMMNMAREINFAETTFIKANKDNERFVVRIFTPEHEVPFAGHPSLGTSYIISKFLLPEVPEKLILELAHGDIEILVLQPEKLDESEIFMRQTQPEFREFFTHEEIAQGLGIELDDLDHSLPVQEISTGLPYIIIPLKSRSVIDAIQLDYETFKNFLLSKKKYRTNSITGHSTSVFFFTKETYEATSDYNARMLLIENNKVSEDAATGSANGCLLAYLLTYSNNTVNAVVEQGFQINRKSYIYLKGERINDTYEITVGGRVKLISDGIWYT